jgi:hypothetical protein
MTDKKPRDLFWFWVVMAFVVVIAAWTTFIIIAKNNPNPSIELSE